MALQLQLPVGTSSLGQVLGMDHGLVHDQTTAAQEPHIFLWPAHYRLFRRSSHSVWSRYFVRFRVDSHYAAKKEQQRRVDSISVSVFVYTDTVAAAAAVAAAARTTASLSVEPFADISLHH